MIVFPAIDLRHGRCVRLTQGRFDAEQVYRDDPLSIARRFEMAGATHLHVVDLDGAKSESAEQTTLIVRLAQSTRLKVQAGGGIRRADQVERLLGAGVARVVIGSLAVREPNATLELLARFGGDPIVLALDVRIAAGGDAFVETAGWRGGSDLTIGAAIDRYVDRGLRTILCTDISRDGTLLGPNVELYRSLRSRYPGVELLASGGIGTLADVSAVLSIGATGVIIGKALYEKRFTLEEALAAARHKGKPPC